MADYTWWKETVTSQVFTLSAPSNVTELSKMISGACREFTAVHGREPCDDEIVATVTDEAITLTFEVERGRLR